MNMIVLVDADRPLMVVSVDSVAGGIGGDCEIVSVVDVMIELVVDRNESFGNRCNMNDFLGND